MACSPLCGQEGVSLNYGFGGTKMYQQLLLSALRVYIFAPRTKTNANAAIDRFIWAYSCSNWTKAQIYLHQHNFKISETSRRRIGLFHLVIGWIMLQLRSESMSNWKVLKCMQSFGPVSRLIALYVLGVLFDDILTFILLYQSSLAFQLRGRDTSAQECMICLQSDRTQQIFCANNHAFHASCLEQWYRPFGNYEKCPCCRGALQMEIKKVRSFKMVADYMELAGPLLKISAESLVLMSCIFYVQQKVSTISKGQST